ncbi:hypothetical protein MMC20_005703 [Loxospora ochrophaea]|nr:hypothetical protein [Loxospora ochrophaea]
MSYFNNAKSSYLDRFPPELMVLVMKNLPDLVSLLNLTRVSLVLEQILLCNFVFILRPILSSVTNQEIEILYLAIVIARGQERYNFEELRLPLNSYIDDWSSPESRIKIPVTIDTLRRMVTLNDDVEFFMGRFAWSCFTRQPDSCLEDSWPPSPAELHRIRRAFLRFELYCAVFGHSEATSKSCFYIKDDVSEQRRLLACFRPWEVEEIACIYKFLENRLGLAQGPALKRSMIRCQLSFGLARIRQLEENHMCERLERFHFDGFFRQVHQVLPYSSCGLPLGGEEYHPIKAFREPAQPFADCPGTHEPNAGWEQTQIELQRFHPHVVDLPKKRGWGYCIWDEGRIREWGLLRCPYCFGFVEPHTE